MYYMKIMKLSSFESFQAVDQRFNKKNILASINLRFEISLTNGTNDVFQSI